MHHELQWCRGLQPALWAHAVHCAEPRWVASVAPAAAAIVVLLLRNEARKRLAGGVLLLSSVLTNIASFPVPCEGSTCMHASHVARSVDELFDTRLPGIPCGSPC
jgi:hypothetical protein